MPQEIMLYTVHEQSLAWSTTVHISGRGWWTGNKHSITSGLIYFWVHSQRECIRVHVSPLPPQAQQGSLDKLREPFSVRLKQFWDVAEARWVSQTVIPSYNHTVIPSYNHTVVSSYNHAVIPSYNHTVISSYSHTVLPSYNHTVIPSYLYTVIPSYNHTVIPHTVIPSYNHTVIPSYLSFKACSYLHTQCA